jgi:dephospho-CoA kinase
MTRTGQYSVFTVALTGGIASGKTLVSDEFARLGVPVIDTDVIARQIVEPGQPALREIRKIFGSNIIDPDGRLRRKSLREIIFSDPVSRKKLESILHPRIRAQVQSRKSSLQSGYCILVIPLLAESGAYPGIDRVLLVDVDPEIQIVRLMKRDDCSRSQAQLALSSQAQRHQRLEIADDVIENSESVSILYQRVANLHAKYTLLAGT